MPQNCPTGRLLIHHSGDASWNMATDQAIAESVSEAAIAGAAACPTLRFYTWAQPTLSLGYFQTHQHSTPRFDSLVRVRRSTGGGAIVHHHELTYSLTVPAKPGEHGARTDLYRMAHRAITTQLGREGIETRPYHLDKRTVFNKDAFLCFQRRTDEDLILSGYKVLGSAQRRTQRALLQHGSLLLAASEHACELPGIAELTSISLEPDPLARQIAIELGLLLGIVFEESRLTPAEQGRADQIAASRFGAANWWFRR